MPSTPAVSRRRACPSRSCGRKTFEWVPAVNVTDRYTRLASAEAGKTRLLIRVLNGAGKRVVARVTVREPGTPAPLLIGDSKGETADLNDMLSVDVFRACPPRQYEVLADCAGQIVQNTIKAGMEAQEVVTINLVNPAPKKVAGDKSGRLADLFAARFGVDADKKAAAQKQLAGMKANASSRELAWQAYKASPAWAKLRQEWEKKTVVTPDRASPYLWRHVGEKPVDGWALVIAMHGGGGAPKPVNDREWQYMFDTYYKEHPEAGGYVYLALRAPNDEWNGFYDDAICPLVERLISPICAVRWRQPR